MAKYNKKIVQEIYELLASGDYIIKDICIKTGITEETFYKWKRDKAEFSDVLEKAYEKRLEAFKNMARSGLALLLTKQEYEETSVEYRAFKKVTKREDSEGNKITEETYIPMKALERTTKKIIMPNPTSVIFTLTNLDPDNFKHRNDITSGGEPIGASVIELPSNGRREE